MPTARLILAPHFLFIIIPLGRPGPQSPRRVSSWGRILRTWVTEEQAEVSHPADVGSLRPQGAPGHPSHPSRGVSAANPHLLRFSQICPRLTTFWSFSLLRRNRRLAAQSQDQTYILLICRI